MAQKTRHRQLLTNAEIRKSKSRLPEDGSDDLAER